MTTFKLKSYFSQSENVAASVYAVDWHLFNSNSSQNLLIPMMMKFQKPIKINIFGVFQVDLELFVFVSSLFCFEIITILCDFLDSHQIIRDV